MFNPRLPVQNTLLALAACALTLSGCSGSSTSGGTSSAGLSSGDTDSVYSDAGAGNATHASTPATDTPAGAVTEAQRIGLSAGMSTPTAPAVAHSREVDRDFLRHMLDHYEAVLLIVHDDMMKKEGHAMHGSGADPVEHDAALDAEKQQMLMLLKRLYGEQYSPRPVAAKAAAAEVGRSLLPQPLAAHFRAGIALVDRSLTALERPQVRAQAIKARATQRARLKAMGEGQAATR